MLSVLLKEPNLSRAADVLSISQPALSYALNQLRAEFNDPLLVRSGNRMELTEKAKALEAPLADAFRAIDRLWEVETLNPVESVRRILIGCADYGAFMTAIPMCNKLAEEAPGISLHYLDAPETRAMANEENSLDFYLVADTVRHMPAFQGFKQIRLFDEEMVYLVGNHHHLANAKNPSHNEINKETFVVYHIGLERYSIQSAKLLDIMEADRNIVMRVQQFALLPEIVESTQNVTILPRRMAERMVEKHNCTILGAVSPAFNFSLCLMWDGVYQSDRTHEYVRNLFKTLFR